MTSNEITPDLYEVDGRERHNSCCPTFGIASSARIMPQVAARMASRDENTGRYQRHRPEQTLLYRIVEEYYPAFAGHLAEQGRELPDYVHREFEGYLKCGCR